MMVTGCCIDPTEEWCEMELPAMQTDLRVPDHSPKASAETLCLWVRTTFRATSTPHISPLLSNLSAVLHSFASWAIADFVTIFEAHSILCKLASSTSSIGDYFGLIPRESQFSTFEGGGGMKSGSSTSSSSLSSESVQKFCTQQRQLRSWIVSVLRPMELRLNLRNQRVMKCCPTFCLIVIPPHSFGVVRQPSNHLAKRSSSVGNHCFLEHAISEHTHFQHVQIDILSQEAVLAITSSNSLSKCNDGCFKYLHLESLEIFGGYFEFLITFAVQWQQLTSAAVQSRWCSVEWACVFFSDEID